MNSWGEFFLLILSYPFVLVGDIVLYFRRLFTNIKYSWSKPQFDYDDIAEVELLWEICEVEDVIFYEQGKDKPSGNFDKIIPLDKIKFNELKKVLKENEILKYNKYIFEFRFTRFIELFVDDICDLDGDILKIKFKNGEVFELIAYCNSKRFDNVAGYIKDISNLVK